MSETQAVQDTTKAAGSSQDTTVAAQQGQVDTKVDPVIDAKVADSSGNEPAKKQSDEGKAGQEAPKEYTLDLPENSQLDASAVDRIASFAKERGLTKDQAQELLSMESNAVSKFAEAQAEQVKVRVDGWKADVKLDKELGGEAYEKNVELAKRVVERFATEDFKKALNETGLGNHPELVRVFFKIGKSMAEDQLVIPGSQTGPKNRSVEDFLYGNKQNN
jgi:hypothetical protein